MRTFAALAFICLAGVTVPLGMAVTAGAAEPDHRPEQSDKRISGHGEAAECGRRCAELDTASLCDFEADAFCAGRCSAQVPADVVAALVCASECKVLAYGDCVTSAVSECMQDCAMEAAALRCAASADACLCTADGDV